MNMILKQFNSIDTLNSIVYIGSKVIMIIFFVYVCMMMALSTKFYHVC